MQNSVSRPVGEADFSRFSLVVAMDERNREALLRLAPTGADRAKVVMMADYLRHHPGHTVVPDPYYGGPEGFELVIDLLEDACEGLLESVGDEEAPRG